MSKMYKKIKNYYDKGFWSETRVRNMVAKGVLTEKEYQQIINAEENEIEEEESK